MLITLASLDYVDQKFSSERELLTLIFAASAIVFFVVHFKTLNTGKVGLFLAPATIIYATLLGLSFFHTYHRFNQIEITQEALKLQYPYASERSKLLAKSEIQTILFGIESRSLVGCYLTIKMQGGKAYNSVWFPETRDNCKRLPSTLLHSEPQ